MFSFLQPPSTPELQSGLNVVTSIPLVVAGMLGLRHAHNNREESFTAAGLPFLVFAFSLILAGTGSIWYHCFPSPANLLWDRLPIALALASLACAFANVYPGSLCGTKLLGPAVVTALASVMIWNWTRVRGHEDLVPYAIVQFAAALFVGYVSLVKWPDAAASRTLKSALAWYAAGRILEGVQGALYQKIGFDYAHPIKHVLISIACFLMVAALSQSLPQAEVLPLEPEVE